MKIIDNASAWAASRPRPWRGYAWPAWVPDSVKVQVEDTWPTPADWERNSASVNAPRLGESIAALVNGKAELVTGRYVHMRHTYGRVVDETDQVHIVTLGRPWPRVERRVS